ncbi:hypothetical protein J6TS1_24500 [Siminovitchia terrae]|uniref:Rhodanese domain-containing protein n=1 Tax=Siminovitchia terrae TaxID=1914933 RepID=A0ABQ4KX03_SIMTE|nr:hypothetical protein J6TS1_24500 [Siminovitchia terrae]
MFVKSVEWLKERVEDEKIRIVDCTYSLNDPSYGKNTYERKHIPGAVHFDLAMIYLRRSRNTEGVTLCLIFKS